MYYYWALQQERQGFVGEDDAYHPPRWQLREMQKVFALFDTDGSGQLSADEVCGAGAGAGAGVC